MRLLFWSTNTNVQKMRHLHQELGAQMDAAPLWNPKSVSLGHIVFCPLAYNPNTPQFL